MARLLVTDNIILFTKAVQGAPSDYAIPAGMELDDLDNKVITHATTKQAMDFRHVAGVLNGKTVTGYVLDKYVTEIPVEAPAPVK